MKKQRPFLLSLFSIVLMSCGSTAPLESPNSVKKEAVASVKSPTKKTTTVKKTPPKKKTVKKAPVKKKTTPKKTTPKKSPPKKPKNRIKAPATATQKSTAPVVDTPESVEPVVKKPIIPFIKKPIIKKPVIPLRTATPVLGRDGYVHNPFNFDEHIDVRGTPSGSIVTPDGDPQHKFKVP